MMQKLVIVESPNKVSTIQKYLGDEFKVVASVGHITKLSNTGVLGLGIDLENWEPKYILDQSKKKIISELKKASKESSFVYIATDPDREGEAIGDHLVTFLKLENKYARVKYNEITKDAIIQAFEKPTMLDKPLIEAQKARRMLDRIIGYRLSKLMHQKISNSPTNPSAGRVQSIALKLIVDREREIEAFIPRQYHKLLAKIDENICATSFLATHPAAEREWIYPDELAKVKEKVLKTNNRLTVSDIKITQKKVPAITPFKQAILYRKSPYTSKVTQVVLQKLYEGYGDGGLISYPRTDSTRLSQTFVKNAHEYIANKFGKDYVATDVKGFSGAQDAHEAIRPTDITLTPEQAKIKFNMQENEFKVYELIYNHTLQALIKSPIRESKSYTLSGGKLNFKFNCSKVIFDGYYCVAGEKENLIDPDYSLDQILDVQEFIFSDHETNPPSRYSEGSLIEALDEIKVGRPSTFASTVKIVLDREYAENVNGALIPTDFGKIVIDKLISAFPNIINEDYTAKVEGELDMIANNQLSLQPVMSSFYERFNSAYDQAQTSITRSVIEPVLLEEPCPEDSGQLIERRSRVGAKFIGCKNFPNCRYTRSVEGANNKNGYRFFRKKRKD
ncbi:type I DNA topoisomerase [Mycoplasmopsis opalescens]|uniref:type I DNA topoisomerase n=1 Tax=Mycoplasmopsis opalescens TaxID=114886 RepID=UPI0004A6F6E5|nr:type I DNA topoisomerase [Mycoplasmopsis opalescens]